MNDFKDPVDLYSHLSDVKVPPEKSDEIWDHIEKSMTTQNRRVRTKRRFNNVGTWLAASLALIVCGVGVYSLRNSVVLQPPNASVGTSKSSGTSESIQGTQPLEAVSSHWRVVIMHTLLKQGPYYNIQLFYKGATALSPVGLTYKWGGSTITSAGNGQPIQPGAAVGAFVGVSFPHGFSGTPPVQVSWTEQGKKYTETVRLTDAQSGLRIENHHMYLGEDAQWNVSYEYETITGSGFSKSYGMLVVTRNGQSIGNNVSCTLSSASGIQHLRLQNSDANGDTLRLDVNPLEKGYNISGNQANMAIKWSGGTDVIVLNQSS